MLRLFTSSTLLPGTGSAAGGCVVVEPGRADVLVAALAAGQDQGDDRAAAAARLLVAMVRELLGRAE